MNKFFLMAILSLSLIGCEQPDKRNLTSNGNSYENEADRLITQKIRQVIVTDGTLSTNAKNIKIITIDGVVTLRGPVASAKEKEDISRKIGNVQGINKVDNQLEVPRSNY